MEFETRTKIQTFTEYSSRLTNQQARKLHKKLKSTSISYNADADHVFFYAYIANVVEKYALKYMENEDKDSFIKGFASNFDKVVSTGHSSGLNSSADKKWLMDLDRLCYLLEATSVDDYFSLPELTNYLYPKGKVLDENAYVYLQETLLKANQEIEKIIDRLFRDARTLNEISNKELGVFYPEPLNQNDPNQNDSIRQQQVKKAESPINRARVIFFVVVGIAMFIGNFVNNNEEDNSENVVSIEQKEAVKDIESEMDYGVLNENILSVDYFDAEWSFLDDWDVMTDDYYMETYRYADLDYYVYEFNLEESYLEAFIGYNLENYDEFIIEIIEIGENEGIEDFVKYHRDYFVEIDYFTTLTEASLETIDNKDMYSFKGYIGEPSNYEFAAKYLYFEKNGVYLQISLFSYYNLEGLSELMEDM